VSGSSVTESSILDNIPGLDDQGPESAFTDDTGDSGSDGGRSSAAPEGGGRSSAAPEGEQGAQPVRRRHDGLVEVPNPQNPNTRDLVDPVSGRTVAQGGIERRVFEEGQRHARENGQLKQQLQAATQQLSGAHSVMQEAQRLNIGPDEHKIAIQVMSDFMRDPVKTLEYLVSEVKSKGYAIPFLENGVTQGMDMAAIQRMIDNKMAPITQRTQAEQQQQQVQAQARQQLDTFLEHNEDARENLDTIAEMMHAQPGLPLDRAYLMMVKWANANGLDHSRSLREQINAHAQQQQPPRQQPTTRPLPGPRSAQQNGAVPDNRGMYSEDSSWSDIIRQSMQDSGFRLT